MCAYAQIKYLYVQQSKFTYIACKLEVALVRSYSTKSTIISHSYDSWRYIIACQMILFKLSFLMMNESIKSSRYVWYLKPWTFCCKADRCSCGHVTILYYLNCTGTFSDSEPDSLHLLLGFLWGFFPLFFFFFLIIQLWIHVSEC